MRTRTWTALALILLLGVFPATAKKKKKGDEEEITQTLPVLKDPPLAIAAQTDRLVFRVAPLSAKGLLSQQVRDALKILIRDNHGANIVKLRAFVAGTGDMRRVQTIVSEVFTEKKLNLPALTTVQAGALPLEGAQVSIESIAEDKRAANAQGLAFFAAMPLEQAKSILKEIGIPGNRVARATCFESSIEGHEQFRTALQSAFPSAAINVVQMQRVPLRLPDTCEITALPDRAMAGEHQPGIAFVNSPKLIITGTQMAFHTQDDDVRLAFTRLRKTLESMNASYKDVVAANIYPLADDIAKKVEALQFEFFDRAKKPAISVIPMESLPSLDASFAVEVIATQ
jgi:enamine deaminase RidA (YjgF/YER057c/UK114 family)